MWVVFLEMGLALFLAIFIVWFTLPKRRDPPKDPADPDRQPSDDDGSGGAGGR